MLDPWILSNKETHRVMFVLSPLASIAGNIIGLHWVVVFGTIGYVPYSAALYVNSTNGTQWFLIFGAVTCGLSVMISVLVNFHSLYLIKHRLPRCGLAKRPWQSDTLRFEDEASAVSLNTTRYFQSL